MIGKLRRLYKVVAIRLFSNESRIEYRIWNKKDNGKFDELLLQSENCVSYSVEYLPIEDSSAIHRWVGAQQYRGKIYAVPSDENVVLVYSNKTSRLGHFGNGVFKWTGGCYWDDSLFFFPRKSNSFMKICGEEIIEMPLSLNYKGEHHYSGVCTDNGVVYQPPRDTNHILKTDLKNGRSTIIPIINALFRIHFRYCGSIKHPNGYLYFFPETGRVIKLDPETDKWCFIGKTISAMCFDAKVGIDGNIYGFSAYGKGIMKINVFNDSCEMIHEDEYFGAYGTKYGLDGCLYSVPGDGEKIIKYNVLTNKTEVVWDLKDNTKAKYAGGVTLQDGSIFFTPATSRKIMILKPDKEMVIPEELYNEFYVDNY